MNRIRIKTVAIAASRQVCLLSIVVLLAAGACFGKPAVSLSRKSGPPTSKLLVSGSGYKPYAEIDIYFDTKDEAKAIANGSGSFSKIAIEAPGSALPGKHFVSAVQRAGDTGAQAPFLVNTNWSQFGFTPDLKRLNPYENVLNTSTVGSLDLLWSYTTGAAVPFSPAVVNGVVFVGSNDGNIYALKASTGSKVWSNGGEGSPAVGNGDVYVGQGSISALSAATGALLWSSRTNDGSVAAYTLADGVVYVGANDEDYAVEASDGTQVWQAHWGYADASSMAFANANVYFCTTNALVYALQSATGSGPGGLPLWSAPCAPGSQTSSSPAVADGVVYVSNLGEVDALNATTGAQLWAYTTSGNGGSSPAVANGVVYDGENDNKVYALNATTGALLWSYTTGGIVTSSPAVANGVVYVGSEDNKLYALNASTGALLWSYTTGGAVESSPAVANGVVYVGSDDSNVYAFGLTGAAGTKVAAKQEAASHPPDLRMLRPDFNLRVSQPAAIGGDTD
jgi:outer membrane protein assembly factor BamB